MKEKVLEAFAELGFNLTPTGEFSFGFEYEGIHMTWLYNEIDDGFMNICIPGIYDVDDTSSLTATNLTHQINYRMKYVKAYELEKSVWIFYERELLEEEEDLQQVITSMIFHLEGAYAFARKTLAKIEEEQMYSTDIEPLEDDTNE